MDDDEASRMPPSRRFPPPWSIEDVGAAFVVKDRNGQKLAAVYYEEEPGRRSSAKLLTRDEARGSRPTWLSSRNYCVRKIPPGRAERPG
jgi:hypothetical protein